MKILVVDDHILFREGLVSMFRSQPDITVVGEASSVHEAIEKTRQLNPGVVLMDYMLPDGIGPDAAQIIHSEFHQIKVVFLTMHDEIDYLMGAVRSGAYGYLLKDLPFHKLVDSLRALDRNEAALSRKMTARLLEGIRNSAPGTNASGDVLSILDTREMVILRHLSRDATNEEIAADLSLSAASVKYHIHKILAKLNLKNRHEAAHLARQNGIGRVDRIP